MSQGAGGTVRPFRPVSVIPGRERWEVDALLDDDALAARLAAWFRSQRGVRRATASAATGRVLILFRPGGLAADIGTLLQQFFAAAEPAPVTAVVEPLPSRAALAVTLRAAGAAPGAFVVPAALTVLAHALHLLQGNAFVRTVNRARLVGAGQTSESGGLVGPLSSSLMLTASDLGVQYRRRRAWRQAGQMVRQRLRGAVVKQLLRQDMAFLGTHGTGQLIDLVMEDTQRIGELVERLPDQVIEKSMTVLYAAVTLVTLSPRFAVVVALPLPLLLLPSLVLGPRTGQRFAHSGKTRARFTQTLEGVLAGITDVRLFQAEPREAERLRVQGEAVSEAALGGFSAATAMGLLTQAIGAGSFGLVAVYGGGLTRRGALRPEDFARVLYIYPMLLSAVSEIESLIATYHDAVGAARRLAAVLTSEPTIKSGLEPLPPAEVKGEVTVEDVSFDYQPGQPVLRNISFTLGPGDMLAVVGRTGSGKSTLLRLLARLYDVEDGSILLDGRDIRQLDLADLRSAIALVSQETYLFEGTIRDNLRYGKPDATDEELLMAMGQAGATDLIERLPEGLDTSVGERGARLSGGERQRVAIARSILRDARLWLLDEITAHLDYETEHAIQLSLREIASDRSTVVVTHRLATIRHATRILVLDEGMIAESGTHDELLSLDGIYAGLWRLQSGDDSAAPSPRRRRARPPRKRPAPE